MPQLELQAQLMSFADRMAVTLSGVWEPVEFGDTTPELRSTPHSLWLYPSVAPSGIATAPDSEAGLLDMVVMVTLLRMTIEDYWVLQVFGEQAPGAMAAYQTLEADIWGVANEASRRSKRRSCMRSFRNGARRTRINTTSPITVSAHLPAKDAGPRSRMKGSRGGWRR